jgi:hypothetical protein
MPFGVGLMELRMMGIKCDYYVNVYADGRLGGFKHLRSTCDAYIHFAKSGSNPVIGIWRIALK